MVRKLTKARSSQNWKQQHHFVRLLITENTVLKFFPDSPLLPFEQVSEWVWHWILKTVTERLCWTFVQWPYLLGIL